jgi:hypothetical protein
MPTITKIEYADPMSEHSPWAEGYYNGFSKAERKRLGNFQSRSMRSGALTRPTRCYVCGQSGTVLAHLEDYRVWGDYFPMCLSCHKALHERYRTPGLFEQWIDMLNAGKRPVRFDNYDFFRWNRLYLFSYRDGRKWPSEPMDCEPDLSLFHAVSMKYDATVPEQFDRVAGAPLFSGQHLGEVGGVDDYLASR